VAGWLDKLLGREAPPPPVVPVAAQPPAPAAAPGDLIAQGNRLLDEGRTAEAAERYALALQSDPNLTDAAVNLGFARMELGEKDAARAVLEGVIARQPGHADALFMLGTMAQDRGDSETAVRHLAALLGDRPDFAHARAPLVRALVALGRHDDAAEVVDGGLARAPRDAELLFLRGNLRRLADDAPAAIAAYRAALELVPDMVEARVPLGHLLLASGDLSGATQAFEQGLAFRPRTAELCTRLGDGLRGVGKVDAACAAYAMALERDPACVDALINLGNAEATRGRHDAARAAAQRATEVAPERVEGWINLGTEWGEIERHADAESCFRHAQSLAPEDARPLACLAVLLLNRGATQDALAAFDRALELDPKVEIVHSQRLFALSYLDDSARYLEAARAYGVLVAAAAQKPYADWPVGGDASPARLRVGLVSGDLRTHPVGFFVESVLPHLRTAGIDVVAFSTSAYDDAVTTRLKPQCAGWVSIVGASDSAAAARIRDERVHVLLDLAGHSAYNRLPVFAWRPAPVQASWLGYWASTGVAEIDHVVADPRSVAPGEESLYVESVWRLPETRLCFTAPGGDATHPVASPPALRDGVVTFGSYQNLNKVGDPVLAAWRRVLDGVPGARLRLQSRQTGRAGEAAVQARLVAAGIDPARVALAPPSGRDDYLRSYAEVDLLLDTFPFPGGTTTCEALWMGVPTVTLAGRTMVANQGRLILGTAGLDDWVAEDVDRYVALAVAKAGDLAALAELRAGLRQRVLASPLFDARRFAGHLAEALRGMWAARRRG
jgi:protein O-GlcNAc transferase